MRYERYGPAEAARLVREVIVPLYEDVYADLLGNPFDSTERFTERVTGYMSRPTFAMTAAYADGVPVGQAFGCTLTSSRTWDALLTPVPDGFTGEAGGTRTFFLNEIMVREQWRRQGIARRLHDLLLEGRGEERAALLVRQENDAAHAAYASWGWQRAGLLRPFPDAPVYDVLVLDLKSRGTTDPDRLETGRHSWW